MRGVQVGDQVVRRTFVLTGLSNRLSQTLGGTVVWVHPRGRYHLVEFQTDGGAVLECFPGTSQEQSNWEVDL